MPPRLAAFAAALFIPGLVCLLWTPPVLAAPPDPPSGEGVFRTFFDPAVVVRTIVEKIADNPAVIGWVTRVGVLLAALFFVYNLHMALVTQQSGWVSEAVLRAAVVGVVLGNTGFIARVLVDLHGAMAAIGESVFEALGGPVSFGQVLIKLDRAREAIAQASAMYPFWQIGAVISTLFATYVPFFIAMLFLGFSIAVYNFLLLGSYLMLALAVIMAPISIAFFATRSMQRFTYEWFQVVVHSALIVLLAKAAVGVVLNASVLGPMEEYANRLIELAGQAERDDNWREAVIAAAAMSMKQLVPILLGAMVGAFTLLNVQGIASAFVGRVESVAGAIAGMYFAMRLAPTAVKETVQATAFVGGKVMDRAVSPLLTGGQKTAELLNRARAPLIAQFDRTLPGSPEARAELILGELQKATAGYYADLRHRYWRWRQHGRETEGAGGSNDRQAGT